MIKSRYGLSCSQQLVSAVQNNVPADELGMGVGSALLVSLKRRVVELATTPGVLNTIQVGWWGCRSWLLCLVYTTRYRWVGGAALAKPLIVQCIILI